MPYGQTDQKTKRKKNQQIIGKWQEEFRRTVLVLVDGANTSIHKLISLKANAAQLNSKQFRFMCYRIFEIVCCECVYTLKLDKFG